MKAVNYKKLAKELSEFLKPSTPETSIAIKVEKGISIYPAESNHGGVFYYMEDVVDFCRVKHLNHFVMPSMYNGKQVCVVKIF